MNETVRGLKLAGEKPVIGFGVCLGSVRIAEMVGRSRFDFAMVDLQHSHFDKESATGAIRSLARSNGPAPFGRVAENSPGSINNLLDAGATGIIVPMIESRQEAIRAVESAYYAPLGKRSKSSPAAVFYGDDYYEMINENINVILMIETVSSAEKAEEILSVPGITGCLVGGGDLRYSMMMSNTESEFDSVVSRVSAIAKKNNVAIGLSVGSPQDMKKWRAAGMDFFLLSHDMGLMNNALKEYQREFIEE
ncbi:hypothetical protein B4O97_04955 [Marispirochaeta aestuarii]|uniref:HpcH/HpaI aldolase/citrate lyase domain-containing protein n=1 Tax=Marispirochaeta aestuarii TaxID=1963862 RepID=A0A1Y1S0Z9_9SPIO|nr:aldolase/citrate lyase family protein [Marispirochaeta aestuarii]ORC36976.1 hypothetical protein B4O97_04955 [Marispirochaeta aestuarii]